MGQNSSKKMLFEAMHKVTGMPLKENWEYMGHEPPLQYNENNLDVSKIIDDVSNDYQNHQNLEKLKTDFESKMGDILRYVSENHGTDKADELFGIISTFKSSQNVDELSDILYKISDWLYTNTKLNTIGGKNL